MNTAQVSSRCAAATASAPTQPIAAPSVGVAQPDTIDPSVAMMSAVGGTSPKRSSFTTCEAGTSSASFERGGPSFGFSHTRPIVYTRYSPASSRPGSSAPAYRRATDTDSTGPMTTSITEGGMRMPSVPPAQIVPADMRTS